MARKLIYLVGAIVILLLIVAIALPFFIDANRFRPEIESTLDMALNRKVDIGNIRLSILTGGVSVEDVAISDDPAFSTNPFLKAKSFSVNLDLIALIFSRAVRVGGVTIDQPEVTLLRSPAGTWNFSSLGPTQTKGNATKTADLQASGSQSSTSPDLSIASFALNNGTITVGNTGAGQKMHTYSQVNIKASNISYTTQFPFQLTATLPGNGSIKLDGKAGPMNSEDTAGTPLSANLSVKSLDLKSTGFIDPSAGLAGVLDFSGTLNSDGTTATSDGKLTATKLQVVPAGSPASEPVEVDYETSYQLKPQTGELKRGDVHIGKAAANLTGDFNNAGAVATVQMKLVGQNMPAPDLESVLPAVGVTLPTGTSLTQGTMNANLAISGPVDKLVIAGPVNLSNGKLAGFDIGSSLSAIPGLNKGGTVGATEIQTFSSDVRVAPEGIQSNNLNVVLPAIGSMTGNGTISAAKALNFQLLLHLGNEGNSKTLLAQASAGGIPVKVQGTTSKPEFVPDMKAVAGNLANSLKSGNINGQNAGQAIKSLGGLFGGKKN